MKAIVSALTNKRVAALIGGQKKNVRILGIDDDDVVVVATEGGGRVTMHVTQLVLLGPPYELQA